MNWKIGQKLVCVDDSEASGLKEGEIYKITNFSACRCGCQLISVGVLSTKALQMCPLCGSIDRAEYEFKYRTTRFREIVDIGDDVESYIKSKINEPELV